jgi:hypothetical protein
MCRACSTHGEWKYGILVGKPVGKRPPGRRWKNNIKVNLRKLDASVQTGLKNAQRSDQWRTVVNMVMNIRVP